MGWAEDFIRAALRPTFFFRPSYFLPLPSMGITSNSTLQSTLSMPISPQRPPAKDVCASSVPNTGLSQVWKQVLDNSYVPAGGKEFSLSPSLSVWVAKRERARPAKWTMQVAICLRAVNSEATEGAERRGWNPTTAPASKNRPLEHPNFL